MIGALGVATAIQAHLQQKMDSIAIMKCLGAKSAQVLRIYVLQTSGWACGQRCRIALGSLVQMAFPLFLARYFQITSMPRFDAVSALQGLLVGVLTVLLFTVPPLLGIRHIRPALIFRREMAAPPAVAARVVEARGGIGDLGDADSVLCRAARRMAERQRADRPLFRAARSPAAMAALAAVAWLLLRGLRWSAGICRARRARSCGRESQSLPARAITRARR